MRRLFRPVLGTVYGASLWLILRLGLLVATVIRPGEGRNRTAASWRMLLMGRMDSKNWCQSHLTPLRRTPEIAELLLVVDGTVADGPKTKQFRVPALIGWIKPRAIIRSLWTIVVAAREKPDVIMAYSLFPPGVFSLTAARLAGAVAVVQLTGGLLEVQSGGHSTTAGLVPRFLSKRLVALCHELCGQFDAVVVRGRKAEAYLREHTPARRVEIIAGSVDQGRIRFNSAERRIDVAFVGRIVAVKQPEHVVEILGRVARRRPGLRAVVAGRGPLLGEMKAQASKSGLSGHVCFAGHVERVEGLLVRSRIFLLTSKSEGLSIALAEAMMAGAVPVVANVGDLSELVINSRTGWLIDPGDFDAYAARICQLLDDTEGWRRMSEEARRVASENNSVEAVVQRWQRCLPQIIGCAHSGCEQPVPASRKSVVNS